MGRSLVARFALVSLAAVLAVSGCGGSGGGGGASASSTAPATQTAPISTQGTTAPVASSAPPRATLPSGTFDRTFGSRFYKLRIPPNATGPLALAICFHGAGDDAKNFFATMDVAGWIAAADKAGVALVVPDTLSPYADFANWSGNPNNDFAAMQTELDAVLALVDQDVSPKWPIDKARTHAVGFSDGGLFVAVVGLGSPRFATATILSFGWGTFNIQPLTKKIPVHMACGDQDGFFPRAQATEAFLATDGHDVLWEPVPGVPHSFLGVSAGIGPAKAIAWLAARPGPSGATTPPAMTPPAPGNGSGGTGGGKGLVTRPITTTAQPGIPSVTSSYDAYVPATYDPAKPIPVVIAANMGLAPWQALADQENLIVIDFRDYDRNGGFTFDVDVACLDATIQDARAAWNVDTKRIYYHGFSAGAHWGYAVVLANGGVFAGLGINAGSLQTAASVGVWPNGVTRKVPVAIRHGTQDTVVPVSEGRAAATALMNAGHPVQESEFAGGHTIAAQDAQAVWAFLKNETLP